MRCIAKLTLSKVQPFVGNFMWFAKIQISPVFFEITYKL